MYGNNSEFSLKELFWALETPSGYQATVAKSGAYNVNDRRVNDTITHTVAKSGSSLIHCLLISLVQWLLLPYRKNIFVGIQISVNNRKFAKFNVRVL